MFLAQDQYSKYNLTLIYLVELNIKPLTRILNQPCTYKFNTYKIIF